MVVLIYERGLQIMIRFGKIISEVGLQPTDFQKLSDIPVDIYDRKNRILDEEHFDFGRNMFSRNSDSKESFTKLLKQLMEKNLDVKVSGRLLDEMFILYISTFGRPLVYPLF